MRIRIGKEQLEHVDELGALHRVAADADRRRLAEARVRRLLDRFISKSAGARDNAHRPLAEDVARHDADLAFLGREHARAVRPDQARLGTAKRPLHAHHVEHRNAFRDADDQRNFGIDGFENGVGRKRRRHVDGARRRTGLRLGFLHRIEQRQIRQLRIGRLGATLARRDAAGHLRAVGARLLGVERSLAACQALADRDGRLVDENGHVVSLTLKCLTVAAPRFARAPPRLRP